MKNISFSLLILILVISCNSSSIDPNSNLETDEIYEIEEVNSKLGNTNQQDLDQIILAFNSLPSSSSSDKSIRNNDFKKVSLYAELVNLFQPDNFNCGCHNKMKRRLNRIKPKNQDIAGYVPKTVMANAYLSDSVNHYEKRGAAVLANSFFFRESQNSDKEFYFAGDSKFISQFSIETFLETRNQVYNNFLFTLDCSGFLSAAITATAGVSSAAISASAEVAQKSKKSLLIVAGIMYSPLYYAYTGKKMFTKEDSSTLATRLDILEAVLGELEPSEEVQIPDSSEVFLHKNYQVIITSNQGESSFNGTGGFEGSAGFDGGVASIKTNAKGETNIGRSSKFSKYDTYLVKLDIGSGNGDKVFSVFVIDLKDKIIQLRSKLTSFQ